MYSIICSSPAQIAIATATWIVAVEHVKDNSLVGRVFKIALHHGKLIEVREQSKVICSHKVLL